MPLLILNIYDGSLAAESDLNVGDKIVSINDHPIRDFLDLQFHAADEVLKIEYQDQNMVLRKISITQNWEKPLGIEPAKHLCRTCANDCIFCFVDQMRPENRETLYIKDDDYRFSFVFGNFITLTNLSKADMERMRDQKLSPMYISVHTANPELHKKMLRYKHNFNIREALLYLADAGLEMHTQIVLIPGWNDGQELIDTLDFLTSDKINALSVGVVPVGITKFRKSLVHLDRISKDGAQEALDITSRYDSVYCSDEFYLLADQDLPQEEFYDDYPQLENGIGMMRMMLDNWKYNKEVFLEDLNKLGKDLVFITGTLSSPIIQNIVDEINEVYPHNVRLVTVVNEFFGEMVTVTGLLAGRDIINSAKMKKNEVAVVSAGIFNDDLITIDNISSESLRDELGGQMLAINEEFVEWDLV